MALIKNVVVKDAVKAEFPSKLLFTRLAGTVVEDADLKGAGVGDTITYSEFELGNTDLQVLKKGDEIETDELGQSQVSFEINHLAHGKKYFDIDVKTAISGNRINQEVASQITGTFAHGLDQITLAAATEAAVKKDAAGGLTTQSILDEGVKLYGENVFDGSVAALVVHPTKIGQFQNDKNFAPVASYGYANAQYGKQEVGLLYGIIPVVMSNKVLAGAEEGLYKNILVATNSVLTLLGKDLNIEEERFSKLRMTEVTADTMVGIHAHHKNKGIVFEA